MRSETRKRDVKAGKDGDSRSNTRTNSQTVNVNTRGNMNMKGKDTLTTVLRFSRDLEGKEEDGNEKFDLILLGMQLKKLTEICTGTTLRLEAKEKELKGEKEERRKEREQWK